MLSTLILLRRLINFQENREVIEEYLTKLIELDPQRRNYYLYLRKMCFSFLTNMELNFLTIPLNSFRFKIWAGMEY